MVNYTAITCSFHARSAFFEKNEHKIAFFLAYIKKMQYLCGGFV